MRASSATHAVGMNLEPLAAEVDRRAVGQVAAMGEVHAQDAVADVEHGDVRGHVRLRPGVRLDVDVLRAREKRQRALLGKPLDLVNELAAAVIALARQALGVLVGQPRALGLEHRAEGVVLAGDQLDLPALTLALADHRVPQLGIDLGDRRPRGSRGRGNRHGEASLALSAGQPRCPPQRSRPRAGCAAARSGRSNRQRSTECRRGRGRRRG